MLIVTFKRALMRLLEPFGQADRARALYRRLSQPLHVRKLPVEGPAARFWVPTAADEVDVEYFTERAQLEAFARHLRPGDVVWDVGAGAGHYSLQSCLRVRPGGLVYAFEPDRRSRRLLSANSRLNSMAECLRILDLALGQAEREAFLEQAPRGAPRLVPQAQSGESPAGTDRVLVRTARDLLSEGVLRAPDCLKLDVEGAEHDVLNGFGDLLGRSGPRVILCEVHPLLLGSFHSSVEDVKAKLVSCGYSLADTWVRGTEEHWLLVADRSGAGARA